MNDTQFLCGCWISNKITYGYQRRFINDKEVCPEHEVPEKGFITKDAITQGILTVPKSFSE